MEINKYKETSENSGADEGIKNFDVLQHSPHENGTLQNDRKVFV